jgi:hypothetical protein
MTSHELLEQLRMLFPPYRNDGPTSYFLEVVFKVSSIGNADLSDPTLVDEESRRPDTFTQYLKRVLGLRIPVSPRRRVWKDLHDEINRYLRTLDLKRYFLSLVAWESTVAQTTLKLQGTDADEILTHSRDFSGAIEAYLSQGGGDDYLHSVVTAADRLTQDFRVLKLLENLIINNLVEPAERHEPERASLALFLASDANFEGFIGKLEALNAIYIELCELFQISAKELPLEIGKVESGSLWVKIFGESRIISSMISLIESTVQYLYRNFTKEGGMASIPKNVEVITSIVNLEHELKESGIDTTEIKEHIRKSSVLVARQLTRLLGGEPKVEVNGREYTLGTELEEVYLAQSKRLLLESKTEIPNAFDPETGSDNS